MLITAIYHRPHTAGVRYFTRSQAGWIARVCAVIGNGMHEAEEAGKRVEAGMWADKLSGEPWAAFRDPLTKPAYCDWCQSSCQSSWCQSS